MMNFIDVGSEKVVGLIIDGKISDDEYEAVVGVIEEKMEIHPKVSVYVELESLGGIPPKTLLKDLKFSLKNMDRFDKEAIVTDKKWLEKLTPLLDKIFTDIEILTFDKDKKQQAIQWVSN